MWVSCQLPPMKDSDIMRWVEVVENSPYRRVDIYVFKGVRYRWTFDDSLKRAEWERWE